MIALAYYRSEQVAVIGTYKEKMLIIIEHNPTKTIWVNIAELDRIVWMIK